MNKPLIMVLVLLVAGVGWYWATRTSTASRSVAADPANTMVAVTVPELSGPAKIGEKAFNARCAACHGANAGGIEGAGPPLIHKIYEPGHHGDMAIVMAARRGVQAHHWRFGNMPPVEGITDAEIASIITYVRTLQSANGIF